jgi:hypothetical protein
MKKHFSIFTVVLALVVLSFTTAGWVNYKDALTGFTVQMPNTPKVKNGKHFTGAPMTSAVQKAPAHPEFIAIGIKTSAPLTNVNKVIDDEIDFFCTSHGIAKPTTYPPLKTGAGYKYKIIKVNNGTIYADLKVCVKGAYIYNLIVKDIRKYAPGPDVNKYFNSFRP